MDPARREELKKRREAMKARQTERDRRAARGSIVPQLAALGVPHRTVKGTEVPSWLPRYLPTTFTRIYWEGAPEPAECMCCETAADRLGAIDRMLRDRASGEDMLLFVHDGWEDSLLIRQADALPLLSILCEPTWTIWITAPPQDWLIESNDSIVRLALPPALEPEEAARADARRRALLAPVVQRLQAAGASYRIYLNSDLAAPEAPPAATRSGFVDWQRIRRTFQACVPRHDPTALRKEVEAFLADRSSSGVPLALRLLHEDAPVVVLSAADFVRSIDAVMLAADRWDETAPGGEIHVAGVHFFPLDGDWLAQIYPERSNWRMRAAG